MGSTALGIFKEGRLTADEEEADYPASFCVWDQDQRANPPLDEESRAKGEDGQVELRRGKDN